MNDALIESTRQELTAAYPGCGIFIAPDHGEMVAEVRDGFAVAVGEPSWLEVETDPPWSPDDQFVV